MKKEKARLVEVLELRTFGNPMVFHYQRQVTYFGPLPLEGCSLTALTPSVSCAMTA